MSRLAIFIIFLKPVTLNAFSIGMAVFTWDTHGIHMVSYLTGQLFETDSDAVRWLCLFNVG